MNLSVLPSNLPVPEDDGSCKHLLNQLIPEISLPNQEGNCLKLNRKDTFRIVLYCYPMTGHPNKPLPDNWENIPGARGCTPETCSIRDHYDDLIKHGKEKNLRELGLIRQEGKNYVVKDGDCIFFKFNV